MFFSRLLSLNNVGIIDFSIACSFDNSEEYCTYDNPSYDDSKLLGYSLIAVISKETEIKKSSSFIHIENLIERVISHESIHVVITHLENKEYSDKLDDLEFPYPMGNGITHIIHMNYLGYANDDTGLVTSTL